MDKQREITAAIRQAFKLRLMVGGSPAGARLDATNQPGVGVGPEQSGTGFKVCEGQTVVLEPSPLARFSGWGFDCEGLGLAPRCTLTMDRDHAACAYFNP